MEFFPGGDPGGGAPAICGDAAFTAWGTGISTNTRRLDVVDECSGIEVRSRRTVASGP
jgi:hypothetical protein